MEQEFIKMGQSELQAKLLSWACTTGEMRNHQAVNAKQVTFCRNLHIVRKTFGKSSKYDTQITA